jgi:integrase
LTFVRTGELIGATWDEIDIDGATWIIPAERMKMKTQPVVPLSRQALAILRRLRAIGGGSRYVFSGRNPNRLRATTPRSLPSTGLAARAR